MKVVMHAHSVWSYDGVWELPHIARIMGNLGADIVMMTEHDTGFDGARFGEYRAACAAASTRRCRLVPGIEYSSPDNDVHMLVWGLDHFMEAHRPVMETLEGVRAGGGAAVLAHPVRRDAWKAFRRAWIPLLAAVELWNRKSDGLRWSRDALILAQNASLPVVVGMDFHRARHLYPLTNRFDIAPTMDIESALVRELACGSQTPFALGRRLIDGNGQPRVFPHGLLERFRRGALAKVRSKARRRLA